MNTNRIKADIKNAKRILTDEDCTEYDVDMAAYHIQQAIEKSLKYYLHDIYGEDDTTRRFRTHDIATLIGRCEEYELSIDGDLKHLAEDITEWEACCRYDGDVAADKETAEKALTLAEELYEKIEKTEKQPTALNNEDKA